MESKNLKEHKKIVNMSFNISNSHFMIQKYFQIIKISHERYDVPRNIDYV